MRMTPVNSSHTANSTGKDSSVNARLNSRNRDKSTVSMPSSKSPAEPKKKSRQRTKRTISTMPETSMNAPSMMPAESTAVSWLHKQMMPAMMSSTPATMPSARNVPLRIKKHSFAFDVPHPVAPPAIEYPSPGRAGNPAKFHII